MILTPCPDDPINGEQGEESHCQMCPVNTYTNRTNSQSCVKCLTQQDCAAGTVLYGKCDIRDRTHGQ